MTATLVRNSMVTATPLLRQHDFHALLLEQSDGLLVERDEGFAAKPLPAMSNHTIGEVAPRIQHSESGLHRLSVERDIVGAGQGSEYTRDIGRAPPVSAVEYPAQFAQNGYGQGNQPGVLEQVFGDPSLVGIVFDDDPDKNVGVGRDFHSSPAQPFAMASFISSIDIGLWPSRLNMPKTSEILPFAGTGLSLIPPPGSLSISSFEPGWAPRCCNKSFLSVIWPLAVTVRLVMVGVLSFQSDVRFITLTVKKCVAVAALLCLAFVYPAQARPVTREDAMRAAIHPVASVPDMQAWIARAPVTRDFPPDFATTLRGQAPAFVIEMSTAPGCVPCADLWGKLSRLRTQYGWHVRTISGEEAMLRSGRLGLPWVGHPVAWVRPVSDPNRIIPIAIGTDHAPNLARNAYLAAKMLTGVRAAVGVRALSKFTGIVGVAPRPATSSRRN